MLRCPPALDAGQKTRAPRRESKEAFTGSEVQVIEARLWQPGGVCLWRLQLPTLQIARFLGAIICRWRDAFTFPLPQSAGRTDSSWQTGSTPAAEMMQSWRDNWWAAGSCLMETHFANLSRGCGVRAAAVSQSNTVFRAFFLVSSSFLCWGRGYAEAEQIPRFDYDSALKILHHTRWRYYSVHIKEHIVSASKHTA